MKKIWLLIFAGLLVACGNPNDPGEVNRLIEQAWEAFQKGEYKEAEVTFTEALNRDAGRVEAKSGLGWSRAFLRNYQGAVDVWQEGLAIKADYVDIHAGLCLVYQVLKKFESCISAGQKVAELAPNYQFPYYDGVNIATIRGLMASAYYGLGQFDQAAKMMDEADPENAPHSSDPKTLLQTIMTFLGLK